MAKVKNISRGGSGNNTYARACVRAKLRVRTWRTRHAYGRGRVIRSLEAASRDIGGYMPAGADLVVNLARGSFLEHVNAGLSLRKLRFLRGAGEEFAVNHGGSLRSSHAERAYAATSRSDIGIYCSSRYDARDEYNLRATPV